MLLKYMGHSQFLLEDRYGTRILTDPYDGAVGYPMADVRADVVTVSHSHGDHSFVSKVTGQPVVIDREGTASPAPDVTVRAVSCWHDPCRGQKRGPNLMMNICLDGIRVLHLGDLGHIPTPEMVSQAGPCDILLVPVGGFFTVDAEQAKKICALFSPGIVIPMHFRTGFNASWPIADEKPFMDLMDASPAEREPVPILRVTQGDLSQQPRLCLMKPVFE